MTLVWQNQLLKKYYLTKKYERKKEKARNLAIKMKRLSRLEKLLAGEMTT